MLHRMNVTGTGDLYNLDATSNAALTRWFDNLKARAARRGLSNLISTKQAHSPGFLKGLTPEQELDFQINAAWRD
jgi:hypothetical protein